MVPKTMQERAAGLTVALIAAAGLAGCVLAAAPSTAARAALYASTGSMLAQYEVDAERCILVRRSTINVPANVQYAWPHPSGRHLYVVWSTGPGPGRHGVSAFDIGATGALTPHGSSVPLKARPIHVTTDRDGTHLLIAYNIPPVVTVHAIEPDGTIGAEIPQTAALDFGVYLHQVRVEPSTGTVFVVARGNRPEPGKAEDPGAIKIFDFRNGQLAPRSSVAPHGGFGFQPRHLDFHPSRKWIFVSLEPQNELQVYRQTPDGGLDPAPLFTRNSLVAPEAVRVEHRQFAGTVHAHPNGRILYQADRGTGVIEIDGRRVSAGGTNAIGVFRIDQKTGEPTLLQNADTHGLVPRTFALDPGGRLLVAANQTSMLAGAGTALKMVPASLAVFRIRDDGTLDYRTKYDVDADQRGSLFWMGIVPLAGERHPSVPGGN